MYIVYDYIRIYLYIYIIFSVRLYSKPTCSCGGPTLWWNSWKPPSRNSWCPQFQPFECASSWNRKSIYSYHDVSYS